jgi:RNA-directed DNA polymerase
MNSNRPKHIEPTSGNQQGAEDSKGPCSSESLNGHSESASIEKPALNAVPLNLMEQIVDPANLERAWARVKANRGAPGPDGITIDEFPNHFRNNWPAIRQQLLEGTYKPGAVRRKSIPKADGGERHLGIPNAIDRLVQQAILLVLTPIFDPEFSESSFGFRPNRSAHEAIRLVQKHIQAGYRWCVDMDLSKFFDLIDHSWLIKFLEQRIGDNRILRLMRKWLHAGVIEEGIWHSSEEGTAQGSGISPLLANVFLHYVFDLWIDWWRNQPGRGDVVVVRYCDDFVIGFESEQAAKQCMEDLRVRLAKFGLKLNESKTRLIEFGRYAIERRKRKGLRRPETFDFLGFTHQCSKTRTHGWFTIRRSSIARRMRLKLQAIRQKLIQRRHVPVGDTGRWLRSVVQGWLNYHGVPGNSKRLGQFVDNVTRYWLRQLRRRSQKARFPWTRMHAFVRRWLPRPRVCHPYPENRHRARLAARAV